MIRAAVLALAILFSSTPAFAAIITVDSFALKNTAGEWVTVIEPDLRVDTERVEPAITFLNSAGRVPPGDYVNLKVAVSPVPRELEAKAFTRRSDFERPFTVKKGSFIRVRFDWDSEKTPPESVREVSILVDQEEKTILGEEIALWS